jgi:endoglucanase
VVVESRWESGWCGHIEITGPDGTDISSRAVTFALPAGTTITQSWNADVSASAGSVRLGLPDWARVPSTSTGFCVQGTGAATDVRIG